MRNELAGDSGYGRIGGEISEAIKRSGKCGRSEVPCGSGYPSTVQLSELKFLTIWYECKKNEKNAVLRQAIWELIEEK